MVTIKAAHFVYHIWENCFIMCVWVIKFDNIFSGVCASLVANETQHKYNVFGVFFALILQFGQIYKLQINCLFLFHSSV